jgi:hypothetical protein
MVFGKVVMVTVAGGGGIISFGGRVILGRRQPGFWLHGLRGKDAKRQHTRTRTPYPMA